MTSTPTRPVDNVVIATKCLQDRNTNIIAGTTVENKDKLILWSTYTNLPLLIIRNSRIHEVIPKSPCGVHEVILIRNHQIFCKSLVHFSLLIMEYCCETWSLTLREEFRLGVFKNRIQRRIFRFKRDDNGE